MLLQLIEIQGETDAQNPKDGEVLKCSKCKMEWEGIFSLIGNPQRTVGARHRSFFTW